MCGIVYLSFARLFNKLHDQIFALGSGDPSISQMYGKPGESTTICTVFSEWILLNNSSRIATFVDHETKSHLEQQHHIGQQAHAISSHTENKTCISPPFLLKANCLCSFWWGPMPGGDTWTLSAALPLHECWSSDRIGAASCYPTTNCGCSRGCPVESRAAWGGGEEGGAL
jgi:hypothetical protein